MADSLNSPI